MGRKQCTGCKQWGNDRCVCKKPRTEPEENDVPSQELPPPFPAPVSEEPAENAAPSHAAPSQALPPPVPAPVSEEPAENAAPSQAAPSQALDPPVAVPLGGPEQVSELAIAPVLAPSVGEPLVDTVGFDWKSWYYERKADWEHLHQRQAEEYSNLYNHYLLQKGKAECASRVP